MDRIYDLEEFFWLTVLFLSLIPLVGSGLVSNDLRIISFAIGLLGVLTSVSCLGFGTTEHQTVRPRKE